MLVAEMVQYAQVGATGVPDVERKLGEWGYRIGTKFADLLFMLERPQKRETKHLQMLLLVHTNMWRLLFGKAADSLERSTDAADEYMISDNDLMMSRYIQVPRDYSSLCCAAHIAGLIEAVLVGAQFVPIVSIASLTENVERKGYCA